MSTTRLVWIIWCTLWAGFWMLVSIIPPWIHDIVTLPAAAFSLCAILIPIGKWPGRRGT